MCEVKEYLQLMKEKKGRDFKNLTELKQFQQRMITDGNPSSKVLNYVLGRDRAELFFGTYIMPVLDMKK